MMYPYLVGNTLVDMPRLEEIVIALMKTSVLRGDVAEVGVYKGGTARWICEHSRKHVLLFDTFTGMPEVKPVDIHKKGDFSDTSLSHVANLLNGLSNYSLYRGIFPRVNSEYADFRSFSFVHLDVDIYDSVKECLEFFSPRMTPGGIILLDDYNEPDCPGAKLATDEFVAANNLTVVPTVQSQASIQY